MERHYQLKITSPTTNIDVDSIDSEEVSRIVQLAGIEAKRQGSAVTTTSVAPPMPAVPAITPPGPEAGNDMSGMDMQAPDNTPGMDMQSPNDIQDYNSEIDGEMDGVLEEIADYDHGNTPKSKEIDTDTYIWEPEHLEQRFGKIGDNTLTTKAPDDLSESIYENLTKAYEKYMMENKRENDDGVMSPLSDPTKPEFDKDPFAGKTPVDDGTQSPMSQIKRQPALK